MWVTDFDRYFFFGKYEIFFMKIVGAVSEIQIILYQELLL